MHVLLQVFHLIEAIELVVRRHFNVDSIQSYKKDTDIKSPILCDVLNSESVMQHWDNVASSIPTQYEQYSVCLLQTITELWINVRGHSFANGWTMKFEKR